MVKCNAFEFRQGKNVFYLCLVKAKEILFDCDVDVHDANNNSNGYQRKPQLQRSKRFSDYLLKCKGTFNSTCFLNIRDANEVTFNEIKNPVSGSLEEGLKYGILKIKKSLYIVDGQHRINGLELAIKEGFDKESYVPVLITVGKKRAEEALLFLIINRTAKGIKADLTDELIYKTIDKNALTNELKSVLGLTVTRNLGEFATDVTKKLNNNKESIWYGKIILPNETRSSDKTVSQKVFNDSLLEAIKSSSTLKRAANIGDVEIFAEWLHCYWQAISKVCPDSTSEQSWRKYSLMKRTGVYVMNQLFGRVIDDEDNEPNIGNMQASLLKIQSLNDDNWNAKDGKYGSLGTSFVTLKNIYSELEMELDTASILEN